MEPAGPESYIAVKVPPYLGVNTAGVVVVSLVVVVVTEFEVVPGDVVDEVVLVVLLQPTSTKEITNRIARTVMPLFNFFLLIF
jgi:hypothetical protein